MKRSGWRNESYRHYLAAKGIATKYKYYSKFGDFIRTTGNEFDAAQERYYREDPIRTAALLREQRAVSAQERATPLSIDERRAMEATLVSASKTPLAKAKAAWERDANNWQAEKNRLDDELNDIKNNSQEKLLVPVFDKQTSEYKFEIKQQEKGSKREKEKELKLRGEQLAEQRVVLLARQKALNKRELVVPVRRSVFDESRRGVKQGIRELAAERGTYSYGDDS